jgi:putative lipoprotein
MWPFNYKIYKRTLLILLICFTTLSATEKPKTLDAYFRSFAKEKKTEKMDSWFSPDKGYHLIGSMISTTFFGKFSQSRFDFNHRESQYFGAGITFSFGIAKELYDSGQANNLFSWKDLSADCIGVIFGVILLGIQ